MRKLIVGTSMVLFAMPLAAQRAGRGMAGMDMTNAIHGSGTLPDGWAVRFDPIDNPANVRPGRTPPAAPKLDQVDVRAMGSGIHFTTGPAGIYYNPKDMGSGVFAISATFTAKKSMHHESYGIFLGGENLQDPNQSYLYFEIRPGMGDSVLVQHRNGDVASKIDKILPWMSTNGAVNVDDAADGHSTNTLMIHVAKDTVHFIVNGKMVKAIAKSDLMGAATNGQTGLRINHNTDIHVEWKGVAK
jgi:hypothetical protein